MTNTKIGEKRNKKIREIHAGVPLDQYVKDVNKGKILQYETKEIDLTKYDNDDLKLELQHCSFKVKQLIKNGIPTWYVSCEKCTEDNEKEIFWASGQEDCAIKPSTIAKTIPTIFMSPIFQISPSLKLFFICWPPPQ